MELIFVNAYTQKPINHYMEVDEDKIKNMIFHLEQTISKKLVVEILDYNKKPIKAIYVNYSVVKDSKVYRLFFKLYK